MGPTNTAQAAVQNAPKRQARRDIQAVHEGVFDIPSGKARLESSVPSETSDGLRVDVCMGFLRKETVCISF